MSSHPASLQGAPRPGRRRRVRRRLEGRRAPPRVRGRRPRDRRGGRDAGGGPGARRGRRGGRGWPGDRHAARPLRARRGGDGPEPAAPELPGTTAPNADALAKAHPAYDATLPPVPAGNLVRIHMTLKDMTVQIAPGVKYATWAFDGGAPGPIIHVRQGQTVVMTLTQRRGDPSLDRLPRRTHRTEHGVQGRRAGRVVHASASSPAIPACSCTTAGRRRCWRTSRTACTARWSSTRRRRCRRPTTSTFSSRSEWYLNGDGTSAPASLDMQKARAMEPDWATFNGYASQYVTIRSPRSRRDGPLLRRRRGAELDTNFHVVGTMFERAWANGDMTHYQRASRRSPSRGRRRGLRREVRRRRALPLRQPRVRRTSTSARSGCSRSATRRAR